ncbi:hypothetical protein Goarm_000638, partial [Gossypium armourianum]|nr:hypothetical protein [Gossypium armourianum]
MLRSPEQNVVGEGTSNVVEGAGWTDRNVQVYTIITSNKVTSKCRVIVP